MTTNNANTMEMDSLSSKHPLESRESWENHLKRLSSQQLPLDDDDDDDEKEIIHNIVPHRRLKDKKQHSSAPDNDRLEMYKAARKKALKKHAKRMKKVLYGSGIRETSVHGMMIDAGSTGSRIHVYEYEPRVLDSLKDVEEAVAGQRLSFPKGRERWTDRIRPGLGTLAVIEDDEELQRAVYEYLNPFIDFAKTVLHSKSSSYSQFPIYLKATAGLRILSLSSRTRVIHAVRAAFSNDTYCPFAFESEQNARVISGEEEAIYGWTAVNFLMGTLLPNTEGSGTVMSPKRTYGALDLGGASTQISFFSSEDLLSDLFKLQIGAAKHWNVYTKSFLYFGINEALERKGARLVVVAAGTEDGDTLRDPCLPGGASMDFDTNIEMSDDGVERWGERQRSFILKNSQSRANFTECAGLARSLLRGNNEWCRFVFRADCSFSDVYQPRLPTQNSDFGEFLAFSNYYHVWDVLGLESRSTIRQLRDRADEFCKMSWDDLKEYNRRRGDDALEESDLMTYCFRASYVFEILHDGYGFGLDDAITASNVVNDLKVDWALGSMLYEINILPWKVGNIKAYKEKNYGMNFNATDSFILYFAILFVSLIAGLIFVLIKRKRRNYRNVFDHGDKQQLMAVNKGDAGYEVVDRECYTEEKPLSPVEIQRIY